MCSNVLRVLCNSTQNICLVMGGNVRIFVLINRPMLKLFAYVIVDMFPILELRDHMRDSLERSLACGACVRANCENELSGPVERSSGRQWTSVERKLSTRAVRRSSVEIQARVHSHHKETRLNDD